MFTLQLRNGDEKAEFMVDGWNAWFYDDLKNLVGAVPAAGLFIHADRQGEAMYSFSFRLKKMFQRFLNHDFTVSQQNMSH